MEGEIRDLRREVEVLKSMVHGLMEDMNRLVVTDDKGCEVAIHMGRGITEVWRTLYGMGWDGEKAGEDWKDMEEVEYTREIRDVGLLRVVGRMKRERDERTIDAPTRPSVSKDLNSMPVEPSESLGIDDQMELNDVIVPESLDLEERISRFKKEEEDLWKERQNFLGQHGVLDDEHQVLKDDLRKFIDTVKEALSIDFGSFSSKTEFRADGNDFEEGDGKKEVLDAETHKKIGGLLNLGKAKESCALFEIAEIPKLHVDVAQKFQQKLDDAGIDDSTTTPQDPNKTEDYLRALAELLGGEERALPSFSLDIQKFSELPDLNEKGRYEPELRTVFWQMIRRDFTREDIERMRREDKSGKGRAIFGDLFETREVPDAYLREQERREERVGNNGGEVIGSWKPSEEEIRKLKGGRKNIGKGEGLIEEEEMFFPEDRFAREKVEAERVEHLMRDILAKQEVENVRMEEWWGLQREGDLDEIKRLGGMVEELRRLILRENGAVVEGSMGGGVCGRYTGDGRASNVANMRERDVEKSGVDENGEGEGGNGKGFWDWVGGGILWRQD